jgi:8-oxo-dGTP pyrophosphatase MutT (NUDIX family)
VAQLIEAKVILTRPDLIEQSGVIPYRFKDGKLEVLLITSRRQKRWVIPKGLVPWRMTARDSAAREAWEEAGVWGTITPRPLDCYESQKWGRPSQVEVYLLAVEHILDIWPEVNFRRRKWFKLAKAIKRVKNIELKALLAKLPTVVD